MKPWHRLKCWWKRRNPKLIGNGYANITFAIGPCDIARDERGLMIWINDKRIQDYEGMN